MAPGARRQGWEGLAINIGDVFWLFRGEGSQLLVDAKKAGEAAGDAGGKAYSAKLKTAVGGAAGAIAGLAFGSFVNGTVALDAATRQLQADTGMTAAEAQVAQKALAGMYANNLQGFDEIGRAMASVHNDLGLTGEAADATTQKFLKLTEVTGGDTAEAVGQADDVLDAFNLTAEHSGELLDKLTLSHQRYGGSIGGSLSALASLGPALTAANMGLDDGIALLNLFNSAGIDAAKAPQALNKALAQVKSPAELRILINDITATEDPFLRAQKASELFGTKAGPQLAQALAQGNLDDFTVSMEDAAGATETAAAAIEDSFGNRAKLALKGFSGALAEVGTNMGDLLTVAALLGPSLTSKISAAAGGIAGALATAWKGAAASAAVQGAVKVAADKAATVYLQALIASDAAGAALTKMWAAVPGSGAIAAAISKVGTWVGGLLAGSVAAAAALGIGTFLAGLSVAQLIKENSGMSEEEWQAQVTSNYARMGGMSPEAARNIATGNKTIVDWQKRDMIDQLHRSGGDIADGITTTIDWAARDAIDRSHMSNEGIGTQIVRDIATGISAHQQFVETAMSNLRDLMENVMGRRKRIGLVIGDLVSKDLADALDDKRGRVRHAAEQTQLALIDELERMIAKGGKVGDDAMEKLRDAMHSKNERIRTAARRVYSIVTGQVDSIVPAAGAAGTNAGNALATNLASAVNRGDFKISADVDLNARYGAQRRASGGPVMAGQAYWVGEDGPELYVAPATGRIIDAERSAAMTTGSTVNNFPPVTVQGALPVRSARDIVTELRRVAELGQLPPPTLSPKYRRREATA